MQKRIMICLVLLVIITIPAFAHASMISYDLQDLTGGYWRYDYTVRNDSLSSALTEFSIYFDYGLYDVLNVESAKANWIQQSFDPTLVLGFPQDGFYNAISSSGGIAPGAEESGFSVSFLWLYDFAPPSFQRFDIVYAGQIIDQGLTVPMQHGTVPEPGTVLLFGSGLAALGLMIRSKHFQ